MTSDLELLRRFAREKSQDAFTALVQRHVNLVYSAALRQVRSPQLAEEIAQSVFADLARDAGKLNSETVLTAWLYSITRRTAIDVIRKESRRQLREQIAVEMNNMNATADDWTQIEPLLDDAMAALDETDRAAILLRYFENKSLREVGEQLKISDDAAQKRVSRAVEKLREFFSKQKITVGASGLAVLISANAIQSAPVGLAATISTAIALTTTTLGMTMIHKLFIAAMAAVAVGTGIYAFHSQNQMSLLQQQQASLNQQIAQLSSERDEAKSQLAALRREIKGLNANENELLRLRNEVTRLRQQQTVSQDSNQTETNSALLDPIEIHTKARFISVPTDAVQFLGQTSIGENGTGLLTEQNFKAVLEALQGASDVETIAEPEVVTSNGRQSQISAAQPVLVHGAQAYVGAMLDETSYFSTNSSTFNLNIIARFNQLTGDHLQPDLQAIQITNQVTLSSGQTVVLQKEIPPGGWMPDETNIPAGPRSLLIFVTPQVVDGRGFPKTY
jgi:RNA polymerase sigma factor (sigma-70 family)